MTDLFSVNPLALAWAVGITGLGDGDATARLRALASLVYGVVAAQSEHVEVVTASAGVGLAERTAVDELLAQAVERFAERPPRTTIVPWGVSRAAMGSDTIRRYAVSFVAGNDVFLAGVLTLKKDQAGGTMAPVPSASALTLGYVHPGGETLFVEAGDGAAPTVTPIVMAATGAYRLEIAHRAIASVSQHDPAGGLMPSAFTDRREYRRAVEALIARWAQSRGISANAAAAELRGIGISHGAEAVALPPLVDPGAGWRRLLDGSLEGRSRDWSLWLSTAMH